MIITLTPISTHADLAAIRKTNKTSTQNREQTVNYKDPFNVVKMKKKNNTIQMKFIPRKMQKDQFIKPTGKS